MQMQQAAFAVLTSETARTKKSPVRGLATGAAITPVMKHRLPQSPGGYAR